MFVDSHGTKFCKIIYINKSVHQFGTKLTLKTLSNFKTKELVALKKHILKRVPYLKKQFLVGLLTAAQFCTSTCLIIDDVCKCPNKNRCLSSLTLLDYILLQILPANFQRSMKWRVLGFACYAVHMHVYVCCWTSDLRPLDHFDMVKFVKLKSPYVRILSIKYALSKIVILWMSHCTGSSSSLCVLSHDFEVSYLKLRLHLLHTRLFSCELTYILGQFGIYFRAYASFDKTSTMTR